MTEISRTADKCFHCGEPIPGKLNLNIMIDGKPESMCCYGCLAVAQSIMDGGLGNYYSYRTQIAATPESIPTDADASLRAYDHPDIQAAFVKHINEKEREANLILEGVVCPACTWLIEKHLSSLKGITHVNVNYTSQHAKVTWNNDEILLSKILFEITRIGYRAYPYNPATEQSLFARDRKKQLQRIGLAGLLGMQVMMISIALYTGKWDIDLKIKDFFHWLSLLLTTPVVMYSAVPFFAGAIRDIRHKYAGMDLPVSLGISGAYIGSIWSTVTRSGDVYYDSVVMFVFFLLLGRYFEFIARKNNREYIYRICQILPATATKLVDIGGKLSELTVPVIELERGDTVLVRPGETIAADGEVISGTSTVNESLITGESIPVPKISGSTLIGGSINIESPLQFRVEKTGDNTFVSQIMHLVEKTRHEKPRFDQLIHKVSSWFVLLVLIIAALVAWYWLQTDPVRWLPVTLSVLVATCPCALALATPTAITVAMTNLLRSGMAITRKDAIEKLARTTHYIFDKTGTLTLGNLELDCVYCLSNMSRSCCLDIAIALEQQSEHPVARALLASTKRPLESSAANITNFPGKGISGRVNNKQYFIGTSEFISGETGLEIPQDFFSETSHTAGPVILLADNQEILAVFTFTDTIRNDAKIIIDYLKSAGKKIVLLSGDKEESVWQLAVNLGIDEFHYGMKPEEKASYVRHMENKGAIVAMTGDGINDAPVLATADISIAMGSGSDLARINADIILLNDRLETLQQGIMTSFKTFRIIRQNILWAILYNILVLPAAASGIVAPWMAALGMSLSSLVVVGNAHRIRYH